MRKHYQIVTTTVAVNGKANDIFIVMNDAELAGVRMYVDETMNRPAPQVIDLNGEFTVLDLLQMSFRAPNELVCSAVRGAALRHYREEHPGTSVYKARTVIDGMLFDIVGAMDQNREAVQATEHVVKEA